MKRPLTIGKLFKKEYKTYEFDGVYADVFGQPEVGGIWLLYGIEKNGKTWYALKLSEYLGKHTKVLYISAEEGCGANFQMAVKRAKMSMRNKSVLFSEYVAIKDVETLLKRRYAPGVVILDNVTAYGRELKSTDLIELKRKYRNTIFIIMAHEKNGQPEGAVAVMAKKLASVIINVKGLVAHVGGRVPGGTVTIDEEKAMLYWGTPT